MSQNVGRSNLLCAHLVSVERATDPARKEEGLLEEISAAGATVSMECPLRKGTAVRIDCRTCELRGKVVGCRKWVGGYLAEVEFSPDSAWEPAQFKPDRLFNPKSMVCTRPGCRPDCVNGSCGGGPEI